MSKIKVLRTDKIFHYPLTLKISYSFFSLIKIGEILDSGSFIIYYHNILIPKRFNLFFEFSKSSKNHFRVKITQTTPMNLVLL